MTRRRRRRPRGHAVAGALLATLLIGSPAIVAAAAPGTSAGLPPPTPVPPRGSPSPFPTVLHTPAPTLHPPEVAAKGAILGDLSTGQVLFSRTPDHPRPIASLTKIMTALLSLERLDPSTVVTIKPEAAPGQVVGLSELGLETGERISVHDLLYGLMLASANGPLRGLVTRHLFELRSETILPPDASNIGRRRDRGPIVIALQ